MKRLREELKGQEGIALFYTATLIVVMLSFMGLAIDLGRGYVVRMHLAKAVDGAALAGSRKVGIGSETDVIAEVEKYFSANFPDNYLGTEWPNPSDKVNVVVTYDSPTGTYTINVDSQATLETSFMKIANFTDMTISSSGEATTRMVDISFVIDYSYSLYDVWEEVQDATVQFVDYFDEDRDRVSLTMFSTSTTVFEPINTTGRGFSKEDINDHIYDTDYDMYTATSEGLYQGWNQLRLVPFAEQSGMRVVILFTDGSPTAFGAQWDVEDEGTIHGVMKSGEFPKKSTFSTNQPQVQSLFEVYGTPTSPEEEHIYPTNGYSYNWKSHKGSPYVWDYDEPNKISYFPAVSFHVPQVAVSYGIPTSFPFFDPTVNPPARALTDMDSDGDFPNHPANASNAARNLLEIIANEIRADTSGKYPIRIYTLGLGDILNETMGTILETGSSILRRVANQQTDNPFYDPTQLEGKYYYAGDTDALNDAFRDVASQITRLSQ